MRTPILMTVLLAASACTGADPTAPGGASVAVDDVDVVRNILTPPHAELVIDIVGVRPPFDVAVSTTDEARVASTNATCAASRCVVDLGPLPDETFDALVELEIVNAGLTAEATIRSAPRWVTTADVTDLRDVLDSTADGDVVGFDSTAAFSSNQIITVDEPLVVPHTVVVEGPTASQLTLDGDLSSGIFTIQPGAHLILHDLTLQRGARQHGGAVSVDEGGALSATEVRFEGNVAERGSAVHMTNGIVELTGCVLEANQATEWGGAVLARGGEVVFTECLFEDNRGDDYGAFVVTPWKYDDLEEPRLEVRDSVFRRHTVPRGVFYAYAETTLEGVRIEQNDVGQDVVELDGPSLTADRLDIVDNTLARNWALRVDAFLSTVRNSRISNNTVTSTSSSGGAVRSEGLLTIEDTEITDNESSNGAGLTVEPEAQVTLRRSVVERNKAVRFGGAAYVKGHLRIEDASGLHANEAASRGGALYVLPEGTVEIADSVVGSSETDPGNRSFWGGAVYAEGAVRLEEGAVLPGNVAIQYGGGVFLSGEDASLSMQSAEIMFGEGGTFGGGLYITGDASMTSDADSTIHDNRAGGSEGGGGVYVDEPNVAAAKLIPGLCKGVQVFDNTDGKDDENNLEPADFCP